MKSSLKRALSLLGLVVVALGSGLTAPASASAKLAPLAGPNIFKSAGSGFSQCMDLGSYATYTQVTLYPCNMYASSQKIYESGGVLTSVGSGYTKCFDVGSYVANTPVTLYPCNGSISQKWGKRGIYNDQIYSIGAGASPWMCMDLGSYATYTPVKLYPCSNVESQSWSAPFEPTPLA
ncbi:RICIN domain-containing protein [Actinokineospora sp. NBRC 105648]|uniref:RICIN domain-containing protein n=1 Tax=Actinokineospora sp. NBRC 105648 TaxID=3032206 RepID=UPI0024A1C84D|nr:RICIN domain-containing protein [Actinokineospora sp. NBRC 105648]GLZ38951.1 hypothetical protein Acsp05_25750 [Actinokineospora sp. NBRC 105648]